MSCIHAAVYFLNMIYVLCYYLIAVVRVTVATLWCTFALIGAGIPWLLAAATAIWCVGQVAQLHRPRATATMSAALQRLMRTGSDAAADEDGVATNKATAVSTGSSLYWPVASRGAALDAPENSMAALRMVGVAHLWMVERAYIYDSCACEPVRNHNILQHIIAEQTLVNLSIMLICIFAVPREKLPNGVARSDHLEKR